MQRKNSSSQEGHPTKKIEEPMTQVWLEKNLGFPKSKAKLGFQEATQHKLERGVQIYSFIFQIETLGMKLLTILCSL
jgi:hypothetical protein